MVHKKCPRLLSFKNSSVAIHLYSPFKSVGLVPLVVKLTIKLKAGLFRISFAIVDLPEPEAPVKVKILVIHNLYLVRTAGNNKTIIARGQRPRFWLKTDPC